MELRTLRSFLAVAREGNVTRAAATLHITQPALSRQLSELEREFGCELLIRSARGVTLTDEGMLLRKRAEEIVGLADRTELEIRSPTAQVEGDVWVGGGESRAMEVIARTTVRLRQLHPRVRLRLHSGNADDVLERVDKGLLDFGVTLGREPGGHHESLVLPHRDSWGVLMRADHPLAQRKELTLADLCGESLIVSSQSHDAHEGAASTTPAFYEGKGLDIVATHTLLYNASLLVEQGLGICVTLGGLVATGEGTAFAFVPLTDLEPLTARVVWKRYQPMSRAALEFLRVLRSEVGAADKREAARR